MPQMPEKPQHMDDWVQMHPCSLPWILGAFLLASPFCLRFRFFGGSLMGFLSKCLRFFMLFDWIGTGIRPNRLKNSPCFKSSMFVSVRLLIFPRNIPFICRICCTCNLLRRLIDRKMRAIVSAMLKIYQQNSKQRKAHSVRSIQIDLCIETDTETTNYTAKIGITDWNV